MKKMCRNSGFMKIAIEHLQEPATLFVAGAEYSVPFAAGAEYSVPFAAGAEYSVPFAAGAESSVPFVAGADALFRRTFREHGHRRTQRKKRPWKEQNLR
jgi:hypothetical protein